jgi:hypothetical protein
MSTLKTNTLSNVAGTASTAIENAINGSAKAWVNFNGTGTVAIRASYNVTSITDNGTGDYTVNFTTALADSNYSFVSSLANTAGVLIVKGALGGAYSTTALNLIVLNTSASNVDVDILNVAVFR